MGKINGFEDIIAWQKAREFAKEVFQLFKKVEELNKDFELKKQLNKSSGSIMDNIAEGYGREGNKEFIHFLSIAKGSSCESKSQLYRCFDRGYITLDELNVFKANIEEIGRLITGLSNYLKQNELRGNKFK